MFHDRDVDGYGRDRGVPFWLGKTIGTSACAAGAGIAFAATTHETQKLLDHTPDVGLDMAIGAIGAVLGALAGNALAARNHNKGFMIGCGLALSVLRTPFWHDSHVMSQQDNSGSVGYDLHTGGQADSLVS